MKNLNLMGRETEGMAYAAVLFDLHHYARSLDYTAVRLDAISSHMYPPNDALKQHMESVIGETLAELVTIYERHFKQADAPAKTQEVE